MAVDIEALYSSIPHKRGIRMAGSFLMAQDHNTWALNGFILNLLKVIRIGNYFIFMEHYLQV